MNKKMIIGALLGAALLFASFAAVASATPGLTGTEEGDEAATNGASQGKGDCDQDQSRLRSQDRDVLRDGSCAECTGAGSDGTGNGTCEMNQAMFGLQEMLRTMYGDAFGDYAYRFMFKGNPN